MRLQMEDPMIAGARKLNVLGGFVVVGLLLFGATPAQAQSNPATCENDDDCVATPQCGGDVCDWSMLPHSCKPAGTGTKGADGWCTTTDMQPTRMRLALVASRTRSGREQDGCCVSRMSETNLRFS